MKYSNLSFGFFASTPPQSSFLQNHRVLCPTFIISQLPIPRQNHFDSHSSSNSLPLHRFTLDTNPQKISHSRMKRGKCNASPSETPPPASELEIEKKFPIPNAAAAAKIEESLKTLGFHPVHNEEFVDWYFDLAAPNWYFSMKDCWIRYREKKIKMGGNWGWRGVWQVKQGWRMVDGDDLGREKDGMTSYREFQGKVAKEVIFEMLSKVDNLEGICTIESGKVKFTGDVYEGHDVPLLSGAEERLVPFARFVTRRSSWESIDEKTSRFSGLKIDLDQTDFGYAVGEVEAVFQESSDEAIKERKETIRSLVDLLMEKTDDGAVTGSRASRNEYLHTTTIGKLEYFLINNRQDHFNALVEAGVLTY
mmetsp:Transcript_5684/g.11356  ORF Transcript_5684/g.11356 Transcript_5684/m.11356 type:complete len:364 (-) Transcript_5684:113-1204(-)